MPSNHDLNRRRLVQALTLAALGGPTLARASSGHEGHGAGGAGDLKLSSAAVTLPNLQLTRQDGARLPLARVFDHSRPVFLNFVFTSCTAICPVLSQVFAEMRERLGDQKSRINCVSVSIDPDYDTPRRLRDYAARFGADANWNFFTGSTQDSTAVQQAFGIYRGDKMNHSPATFIRAPRESLWTRVDGFASPAVLVEQYRKMSQKT